MFDLHSHILPAMDDGSADVAESLALLRLLGEQGVDTVAATPHFYAFRESPARFLRRRAAAYEKLLAQNLAGLPQIVLGAEVYYYPGISRSESLGALSLGESGLLLLEMPFQRWEQHVLREVLELHRQMRRAVVLAHIDRYFTWVPDSVWSALSSQGILFQVNAGSLLTWRQRRRVGKLFRAGLIQFLGSDCHNLVTRPPQMDLAQRALEKSLGGESLEFLEEVHCRYFPRQEVELV